MKTKIYLLSIGLLSFFLFTGYHFQKDSGISNGKPEKKECPYLQGKSETTCPYIEGKIIESNSSCPYLSGELKCPYSREETKTDSCPYLNKNGEVKKNYKTIKNTST